MKKRNFLFVFTLFTGLLPAQSVSVKADEEAIRQAIVNETTHWLDLNYDGWASCYLHTPYLTWTVTNGGEPGDVVTMRGWDSLDEFMKNWFKSENANFATELKKTKTTRDHWQIQVRGNVAWASFEENHENETEQTKSSSTETRVLEKMDGQWKIVMLSALADFKDATPPIRTRY